MGTTLKMRAFNAGDVFAFVDLLSLVRGSDIRNILSPIATSVGGGGEATDENRGLEVVLYMLNTVYRDCRDKAIDWFASLYGVTKAEFLSQPPQIVIDTIEEIVSRKESTSFFSSAYALFQRIGGSGKATKSE